MAGIVVTAQEYLQDPAAVESRGHFRLRFLAEGDSWMDKSSVLGASLPHYLVQELDRRHVSALIINLSHGGDTLRRMTDVMQGSLAWWLRQFRYDALLFSAGGNDLIDACLDPDAGQGVLRDLRYSSPAQQAQECVNQAALTRLLDGYLAFNFSTIYTAMRSSLNASTPIFLNAYDTPTARNAPVARGIGPWLYAAYRKNHIPEPLWPALTALLFEALQNCIQQWCTGKALVHCVPTTGVLQPASSTALGSSGDWANEIHPNARGWKKLAPIWADAILTD